jgi:hypothetical protein
MLNMIHISFINWEYTTACMNKDSTSCPCDTSKNIYTLYYPISSILVVLNYLINTEYNRASAKLASLRS